MTASQPHRAEAKTPTVTPEGPLPLGGLALGRQRPVNRGGPCKKAGHRLPVVKMGLVGDPVGALSSPLT
ncbi:MAG TPA: hypothetical protein VGS09_01310 [Actinomycetota bacterium]|nr:hypothetical protein [Actinomycetota bacterium]